MAAESLAWGPQRPAVVEARSGGYGGAEEGAAAGIFGGQCLDRGLEDLAFGQLTRC